MSKRTNYNIMNCIRNHWVGILAGVCTICVLANLSIFVVYRFVFNGNISHNANDWNLFVLAFNGLVTAILAAVNICVFIKINGTIERNNENRHVRDLLYEAQTILSKIRFDDYKQVSNLINDVKVSIYKKHLSSGTIEQLKKVLMSIDGSFMYKSQKLHDEPFLRPVTEKLVVSLDKFVDKISSQSEIKPSDADDLQNLLSSFLNIMEFHIIAQLIRGTNVQRYISRNQDEIDCTISCIYDFAKEINKSSENDELNANSYVTTQ